MTTSSQTPRSESLLRLVKANWIWIAGPLLVMLIGALVLAYLLAEGNQPSTGNVPYELI